MNKPITILREEFLEKHFELINTSGLPAFVLMDIFENTLQQLRKAAEDQYRRDMSAWNEQLQAGEPEAEEKTEERETA